MCMLKLAHFMVIVPVAVLLTASYFVIFSLRRVEEKALKIFGFVVVGFLWLAILMIFLGAISQIVYGPVSMKGMTHHRQMKMDCMSKMMQKNNPPAMTMPEKEVSIPKSQGCQGNKGFVVKSK